MATSYTSDKKIGALDPITGSLSANDEIVVNKNGDTLKASMTDVEKFAFSAKTPVSPQTGDVVVIRRGTDIRQVTTENLLPDQSVSNQQISNSAAIAHSKLATMAAGSVMLGNASNVPTATSVTGDVTISNTGVTTIASGAVTSAKIANGTIVNEDINDSAAISLSKLATGALPSAITVASANLVNGTIVNEDINDSASIALSKLATGALPSAITVSSTNIADGAINHSKLASLTSGNILVGSATNVPTATAVTGDVSISDTGVTSINTGVIVNGDINNSANIAGSKLADDSVTADKLDGVVSINQQTVSYPLVLSDAGRVVEINSSSALTVTVPQNSSVPFAVGATIVVVRRGSGEVTISPAAGGVVVLRSADSRFRIGRQYAAVACIKIGTDEWLVVGNLKT